MEERSSPRERARELYEQGVGSLAQIAVEVGESVNTVKSWKKRDKDNGNDWIKGATKKKEKVAPKNTKGCTQNNKGATNKDTRKKKIAEARVMVENGASLSEAADQTGLPTSTLKNHSASGGWIDQQIANITAFQEEVAKEIMSNKRSRLKINRGFTYILNEELKEAIERGKMSKALQEKLLINQETEDLILGVDRLEKLISGKNKYLIEKEKLDIDRESKLGTKDDEDGNILTIEVIDDE